MATSSQPSEHTYELSALTDRLKELYSLFTDERTKIVDGPAEVPLSDKQSVAHSLDTALRVL